METLTTNERMQEALNTHTQVIASAEIIANGLYNLGQSLKKMRDEKLYVELGFESFTDYTKEKAGIGERQAYSYIKLFEDYGAYKLNQYAHLGITKLQEILKISAVDRDDFIEQNDLSNMSVKEVKALVEKNTTQSEQITLLETKISDIDKIKQDKNEIEVKYKKEKEKSSKIKQELETLKKTKNKVEFIEPSIDDLAKIRKEIEDEFKIQVEKEKEDAVAVALANEKAKAEELAKNNDLKSDPAVIEMMIYFDQLQDLISSMKENISKISDKNVKNKLINVVNNFVEDSKF